MGTEPARLHEQLEAALAPAWVIERALRSGGMSHVLLVNDARPRRRIVAKLPHPNLAGDVAVRRVERTVGSRQDVSARCVDLCALGVTSALGAVPCYGSSSEACCRSARNAAQVVLALDSVATPGPYLAAPPRS